MSIAPTLTRIKTMNPIIIHTAKVPDRNFDSLAPSEGERVGVRGFRFTERKRRIQPVEGLEVAGSAGCLPAAAHRSAGVLAGELGQRPAASSKTIFPHLLIPVPGSATVPVAVVGVSPTTSPAAQDNKRAQPSPDTSRKTTPDHRVRTRGLQDFHGNRSSCRPGAPTGRSLAAKTPFLTLCLLVLATLFPSPVPAAEAPLIGPTFPVFVFYQLGSTNLCKYAFGGYASDCYPLERAYRHYQLDVNASAFESTTECSGALLTQHYSYLLHETITTDPATYVAYGPYPSCDYSRHDPPLYYVGTSFNYSGSASVVYDPHYPTDECSISFDSTTWDTNYNSCWDGYLHDYEGPTSNVVTETPTNYQTVFTINSTSSAVYTNGDGSVNCVYTNVVQLTNTTTETVSDEYTTAELVSTTINFDDPTWYFYGFAYGGIDESERCAFLLGMNYKFWFIAPAGKPFNFQYDERFIPDDTTIPSSIIKIGTVSGVGTGQWQSWGPVQSLPHFYTVSSGGCTFTRGGMTIVEIPPGNGGGLGNGNGNGNGDGNGFGDGNGGNDGFGNVGCATCACSPIPGGVTASAEGVNVKVNLGSGQYGQAQGSLVVTETNCSTALFTPATLHYLGGFTNNIQVIPDGSGNVRQVKAPQSFADVVTDSGTSYEIRLYTDSGSPSGGLYHPGGTPFKVIKIEQLSTTNQLQLTVTDNTNSVADVYEYVWNSTTHGWTLTSGGGFRQDVVAWSSGGLMKTNAILNGGGTAVYRAVTYFEALTNGLVQTQKVVDPGGGALTSKWFYYDNTSTDGTNYGKLKLSISPSGFWQSYKYDSSGLITNLTSQFLNAATNANPTNCRVVSYSYTNINSSLYAQTVVETLLGQEISRTYDLTYPSKELIIRCQTPGAAWNATNNLVTTNLYVPTGEFAGKVQSIGNPDGTMTIYSYTDGGTYLNTTVSTGQPNSTGTAIIDGTQTDTAVDSSGALWVQTSTDIKSTIQTQNTIYNSNNDFLNRPQETDYMDGTSIHTSFACCGADTTTAKDGTVTTYYYDAIKRQTASMVNSITTTNILDPAGRVLATIRIGSSSGRITNSQAAYDLAGRVMLQTNALSGVTKTTNTFDGSGQMIVTNTNPDGGTIVSTYAQDGALLNVAGTAANPTSYIYGVDSNGVFTTTVKLTATGGTNEWTKSYTDLLGRAYLTVYAGAATNPSSVSHYNSVGQLFKEVDPDGVITLYGYNPKGEQVYSAQDMNQNGLIDFNGTDRITFKTNDVFSDSALSANVRRSRTYVFATNGTAFSNLVSTAETLVSGLQSWQILWNAAVGITNHSQTGYDGAGIVTETDTTPDGSYRVAVAQYGQATSDTSYDGNAAQLAQTTFVYDQYGRQNSVTDARNGTTTFTFDNAGNLNSTTTPAPGTGPSGQLTTNFFDKMSRMTGTTLPDGTSITNLYLVTGQVKQTSGSHTYPAGYGYDAQGRMTAMTNWSAFPSTGSRVTTWNYDAYRGFVTNKVYAGSVAGPGYTYTAAGRVFTRIWAGGIYTTNIYNLAGQLSATTYSDGTTSSVLFGFDRRGRNVTITNGATVTTIAYNDQGGKQTESYSGGPLNGISVTNGYDFLLRRTNLVARNSGLLNATLYRFDAASRLASVSDGTNSATYSYLANSPLVSQIVFTNGSSLRMTTSKSYDHLNRLSSIGSANASSVVLDSHGYAYNAANQRTSVTNTDGTYWIYKYDSLGQVTSGIKYWPDGSVVAGQQFGYAFDNIGNRTSSSSGGDQWGSDLRYENYTANNLNQYTSRTVPGAVDVIGVATNTAAVTVNNQATYRKGDYFRAQLPLNNASGPVFQSVTNVAVLHEGTNSDILTNITGSILLPPASQAFLYDSDGNMTSDSLWNYGWDGEHRLISMTNVSGFATLNQRKLDFVYDYTGRRIQKIVSTNSGGVWVSVSTNLFIYDGWNLLAELNAANNVLVRSYQWGLDLTGSTQGAGGIGGLTFMNVIANGVQFFCYDGDGNSSMLITATGSATSARYEYSPFGELIQGTGSIANSNPFRFSTKYYDDQSDLTYYGYRYLSSSTGRWLSRDPLQETAGANVYSFVGNRPLCSVDLYGLEWLILRQGAPRAIAFATSAGDTLESLAKSVHLDVSDYRDWLREVDGGTLVHRDNPLNPQSCWTFSVPNTVFIDKGIKKFYDIGPFDVLTMLEWLADDWARDCRMRGYHVVQSGGPVFGITRDEIIDHLQSEDLYMYGYFGHGGDGAINTAGFFGSGGWGSGEVDPDRYTHHGIALMRLFACESMIAQTVRIVAPSVQYQVTPWEANAATRGHVEGFTREVTGSDLLFRDWSPFMISLPGTNTR